MSAVSSRLRFGRERFSEFGLGMAIRPFIIAPRICKPLIRWQATADWRGPLRTEEGRPVEGRPSSGRTDARGLK